MLLILGAPVMLPPGKLALRQSTVLAACMRRAASRRVGSRRQRPAWGGGFHVAAGFEVQCTTPDPAG